MKKHNVVMYGGAFNPPHLDHTGKHGIIGKLLDTITDKVIIIPTGKRDDKWYHGVSDADRLEMLRRATEEYGDRVEIDSILLEWRIESTTRAQADYLREKFWYDVAQVFGSDVAPRMLEWDPTGYVAYDLPKVFVTRPWYEITGVGNYDTLEFNSRGFSSTDVRREVARILDDESCASALRGVVHEKVLDYILENRLFTAL